MWDLTYSPEAANYLFDNFPYIEKLDHALIALSLTESGIPKDGAHQLEPSLIMCEIENHTVVYRRTPETKTLRINVLKPLL